MRPKDIRDFRIVTREISAWAREMSRQAGQDPAPSASLPLEKELPPGYSYVTCKDCDAPAILLHALRSFAAFCPACRVITMIDSIDDDTPRKVVKFPPRPPK